MPRFTVALQLRTYNDDVVLIRQGRGSVREGSEGGRSGPREYRSYSGLGGEHLGGVVGLS